MTLRKLVEERAQKYSNKVFLYWEDMQITYSQLNIFTNKIANFLYDLGIRKGDKVSLFLPNMPEFVYFYLGIPKLGAVCGPINAHFKSRELQFVVNHSEAKILVTIPKFMEIVNEVRDQLPNLKNIILIGDPMEGTLNYKELIEKTSGNAPPEVQINEKEDPAAILYTSGTTGFPKGVLQTHFNIRRNAEMLVKALKPREDFRFMLILPLFHVNAQIVTVMTPLTVG
ncbi:MAG: AMP-binding protein, partial [Candidatus Helarchaeota archaeon]